MPPTERTHDLPRSSLPLTGWSAGAALAFVQGAIGAVDDGPTVQAMLVIGAVGLAAGLMELAAAGAGRAVAAWLERRGWSRPTARALAVTTLIGPGLIWMTTEALSGRRMAALPSRPLLLAAAGFSLLLLAFLVTRALAAASTRWSGRRRSAGHHALVLGSALAACGALVWADNRLLVRRYEWFHLALQLAAFLTLQLSALSLWAVATHARKHERWRGRPSPRLGLLAAGVALAAGWRASEDLWSEDRETARAQVFSADGVLATVLELLRPSHGLAAPPAPRSVPRTDTNPGLAMRGSVAAEAPFRGVDVVLVTIDALRADHLGFAGYRRATSPNLDALAARSTVFERAYTSSPHTSFAITSILTGRHSFSPVRAGLLDGVKTLADAFGAAGYASVGLFPPAVFFVERERFAALERRRYGFGRTRFDYLDERQDAPVRTMQAIEALENTGGKPAFVWIHYFGPHEPYMNQPDLPGSPIFGTRAMDRYDEEIRHVDRELGRLLDHLDRRKRPYIMIVTADHGEEFGDHGGAYHGTSLYDEQIRVPLVVRVPHGHGRRVRTPVSTVDIAATLTSLVGLPWQAPEEGVDRAAAILAETPSAPSSSPPVIAELESMKALIAGEHKLVCDTARDYCRLFDLARDPAERRDIAPALPLVVERLRVDLDDWLRRAPGLESPRPVAALLWAAQRWDGSAITRLGQVLDATIEGDHPTSADRLAALKLMAREPREAHRPALTRCFRQDPDAVLRVWAAVALAHLGDATAVVAVAEARKTGRLGDPELESPAALALAAAAHDDAGQAIIQALPGEGDVNVRCRLVTALAESRDPHATQALLGAYAQVRSRICVAKALARAREEAAFAFLVARLRDEPYSAVRAATARALGTWRHEAAADALLRAFRSDPDEAVTAAAAKALAGLGTAVATAKGRRVLRVPADARELWVVAKPTTDRALPISARGRIRLALKADLGVGSERDVYSLALTPGETKFIELRSPATHALFR